RGEEAPHGRPSRGAPHQGAITGLRSHHPALDPGVRGPCHSIIAPNAWLAPLSRVACQRNLLRLQVLPAWGNQVAPYSAAVRRECGLTLPSRGRPTSGFACCRPPLMSNV